MTGPKNDDRQRVVLNFFVSEVGPTSVMKGMYQIEPMNLMKDDYSKFSMSRIGTRGPYTYKGVMTRVLFSTNRKAI